MAALLAGMQLPTAAFCGKGLAGEPFEGEAVTGACWFQPDGASGKVVLAIDRPSTLSGMDEAHLLDPGYTPEGDWADGPLLGLGFSLRLIRSRPPGCGGSLDVGPDRFLLRIPVDPGQARAALCR